MRTLITRTCLALCLVVVGASSALAASTTVQGTGSYDKLVVKNGVKSLVFKVYAPGGKCDIKYLAVKFRDRDGTRYEINGGCYQGGVWAKSLVRGTKLVDCPKFTLAYDPAASVWTGSIPRTCLKGLAADVKVTESWVDDYSPNINEVPATPYVKQG